MTSYELEQVNRRIYDLMQKIEYLFEHPAIVEIQRKIDELQSRIEDLEETLETHMEEVNPAVKSMETLGLTEFKAELLEALKESPEAQELTEEDLKQLHADYFKSGLTFKEWLKQYLEE
jgi:chromosome segregation ATPase